MQKIFNYLIKNLNYKISVVRSSCATFWLSFFYKKLVREEGGILTMWLLGDSRTRFPAALARIARLVVRLRLAARVKHARRALHRVFAIKQTFL